MIIKKSSFFLNFFILCFFLIFTAEFTKHIINFDQLIYNSFAEKITKQQMSDLLIMQKKWQWVSFLLVPIFILVKISIISSIICIGAFFFNNSDITFKNILNCVLKAEFIFLLLPIFKIIWFYFFQTDYTLEDVQYFYPLSALNITGYKGVDPWLLYPLQTLNLFEVAYIIYLSFQIGSLTKTNADNGLKILVYSYVPALMLWVFVIMFFTINYS